MLDLMREACLIDGAWVTGDDWIEVDNPATGEIIGRVPNLGAAETEEAIAAAERAMPAWAAKTAKDRAQVLRRFFDLMMRHQDALAALLTREQGKPLAEAKGEIAYAASFLEWFGEEAKRVYGEVIPAHAPDKRIVVLKQPIGVIAAITPWNFPAAMITRKIGPALAAGCAVVLKPASQTPFSALALGVLADEAGLPSGLLNIVTGNARAIGATLTASPVVRKLSFTGSTEVGTALYAQSAPTIKKLSLELGGNAPFIVFDDADLDAAVAALQVGDGMAEGTTIGPLIDENALKKAEEHIADATAHGARVVTGGARHERGGRFFQPTVLADVTQAMLITREETFGPVAPVIRFATDEQAIALANDTPFGLAAYFYARDLKRVWTVAEGIEAGIVGVNTGIISTEVAPFGGVKLSGLGREGSRHGIEDYLEVKYVCMGL